MNILEKIIATKAREVEKQKNAFPAGMLAKSKYFPASTFSLKKNLLADGSTGIIAEFKRKSPSAGIINAGADIAGVCAKYESAGVSAISVLTDREYFGGSLPDLEQARKAVKIPILRKDFIIDEYQVIEAKSSGADAILLIAAVLERSKIHYLHRFALSLGLEVLVEVHDESCIRNIPDDAEIIGINCRDLKSFTFKNDSFQNLVNSLPGNAARIAESGIKTPEQLISLRKYGFDGFLIGSLFMKSEDPGNECSRFISAVNKLTTP